MACLTLKYTYNTLWKGEQMDNKAKNNNTTVEQMKAYCSSKKQDKTQKNEQKSKKSGDKKSVLQKIKDLLTCNDYVKGEDKVVIKRHLNLRYGLHEDKMHSKMYGYEYSDVFGAECYNPGDFEFVDYYKTKSQRSSTQKTDEDVIEM